MTLIDVLSYPRCSSRMSRIAWIVDSAVIRIPLNPAGALKLVAETARSPNAYAWVDSSSGSLAITMSLSPGSKATSSSFTGLRREAGSLSPARPKRE